MSRLQSLQFAPALQIQHRDVIAQRIRRIQNFPGAVSGQSHRPPADSQCAANLKRPRVDLRHVIVVFIRNVQRFSVRRKRDAPWHSPHTNPPRHLLRMRVHGQHLVTVLACDIEPASIQRQLHRHWTQIFRSRQCISRHRIAPLQRCGHAWLTQNRDNQEKSQTCAAAMQTRKPPILNSRTRSPGVHGVAPLLVAAATAGPAGSVTVRI